MNSIRQPPQTGAPRLVRGIYGHNLRPVILATSSMSALWALIWAIGEFQNVSLDESRDFRQLAKFSIALGVMYLVAALIEIFGITVVFTQRVALIKVYALGSVLSALLLVAGALLGVIVHFTQKNDIISSCTTLVTGDTLDIGFGWFGPSTSEQLNAQDAAQFCQNGWDHESWSDIIVLLAEICFGGLFSLLAFAYYRQCLDPTSAANSLRAPSNRMRAEGAYPQHYNPAYGSSLPNLSYDAPFVPPSGPPPRFSAVYNDEDHGKPPMYSGEGYSGDMDKGGKQNPFDEFEESGMKDGKEGEEHDEFHV